MVGKWTLSWSLASERSYHSKVKSAFWALLYWSLMALSILNWCMLFLVKTAINRRLTNKLLARFSVWQQKQHIWRRGQPLLLESFRVVVGRYGRNFTFKMCTLGIKPNFKTLYSIYAIFWGGKGGQHNKLQFFYNF